MNELYTTIRKEIIVFLAFDEKYGLTYHFVDWLKELSINNENQFEYVVVTLENEQEPGLLNIVKSLPRISLQIIKNPYHLHKIRNIGEASLIHCHGFRQLFSIQKTNKISPKTRFVITLHAFRNSTWQRVYFTNLMSMFCLRNRNTWIHFLSIDSRDEFIQRNIAFPKNGNEFIFPLGCSASEFAHPEEPPELIGVYDRIHHESRCQLIYLAGFNRNKRHVPLIDALKNELLKHNAVLWCLGDGPQSRSGETGHVHKW